MGKIRNKIITISGEPVSGKSTVVKRLKSKYEEMGYRVEIISAGRLFRDKVIEAYLKMYPDRTDVKLADIQKDKTFAEKLKEIDNTIDESIRQIGESINSIESPDVVYIVDSRLAWHNIPDGYAVHLTVDEKIAGERVFKDKSRGSEDTYTTVDEAAEKTRQRKWEDIERYKKLYNVDLTCLENYRLVVNTSYSDIEELAQIIIDGEEAFRNGTYYPKMWASPACFIGTQSSRDTDSEWGACGCRPDKLAEKMKQEGFNPQLGEITILENYGEKYVSDGHHRAMAVLAMGKTLVPYQVYRDEYSNSQMKAEQNNLWFAYDWSDCIKYFGGSVGKQEQFRDFSIKDLTAYENRIKAMIEEIAKKRSEVGEQEQ